MNGIMHTHPRIHAYERGQKTGITFNISSQHLLFTTNTKIHFLMRKSFSYNEVFQLNLK